MFALVSSISAAPGAGGGTTGDIDTTSATIIFLTISDFGGQPIGVPTDSKSNTWTKLLTINQGSNARSVIYFSESPTVGTGHNFTYSKPVTFPAIMVASFSGALLSSPFDQENGSGTASSTSQQPGSVTPSESNEILICNLCVGQTEGSVPAIDSSFTDLLHVPFTGGINEGGHFAFKIQGSSASENPNWTWLDSRECSSTIATFKSAPVSSDKKPSAPARLLQLFNTRF